MLIDTQLLLWAAEGRSDFPRAARDLMLDSNTTRWFSVASIWEVAIKAALGRPDFNVQASVLRQGLLENGYHELTVTGDHATTLQALPPIHKDPFDRMLVTQALVEGMILLTTDGVLIGYGAHIELVAR